MLLKERLAHFLRFSLGPGTSLAEEKRWFPPGGGAGGALLLWMINAAMVLLLAVGALSGYSLTTSLATSVLLAASVLVWASLSPLSFFAPAALLQTSAFVYVAPLALNRWMRDVLTLERAEVIAYAPVDRAIWLALLAAAAFSLAATPWALASYGVGPARTHHSYRSSKVVALACLILGAVFVALLVQQLGGFGRLAELSYAERYLAMRGKGLVRAGADLIFVGGVIYYATLKQRPGSGLRRLLIVVLMLAFFGCMFFIEQRRMAVFQFVLTFLVLRHAIVRRIPAVVLVLLALAVGGAGIVQGLARGMSANDGTTLWAVPGYYFHPANSEFGQPTLTIADILARVPRHSDWLDGKSYVDSLGVLVPSAIWPARPQALGERYAAEFYPEYWESGGAWGFTPVGEAYWNWGTLGVVAVFGLLGAVAQSGERLMARRLAERPSLAMMYALLAPFLIMFYRFDSASFMKGSLALILPLLLILGVVNTLDWMTRVVVRGREVG